MPTADVSTIRPLYLDLVNGSAEPEVLEDLLAHCEELKKNNTQHDGEAQIIEITSVEMLCEQRRWKNHVPPENVLQHMRLARSKSYIGYVLASLTLIDIKCTDSDARLTATLKLLEELPAVAAESQICDTDRKLAGALLDAFETPSVRI